MSQSAVQVQSKILRRMKGTDDYGVYRAALEWGLVDPIVINNRDDLKSEIRWHDRVEPFHHQVTNLITYCRRLPVTLLADDVGLGKTISAGLIASELISRRRLNKILIVAPKLLGPQWKEELETKFDIPTLVVFGKHVLSADPDGDVGAVVTTYHSAREYIKRIPRERFQMLILDEAHKLRNLYGVPTPPKVAVRFREVLADRTFKYVLMLTATPIQNRLWDLYSLVDLLTVARGHQNPFGSEGLFSRNFIADNRTQARQLKIEAREQFRSIVYSYMSRVRRADANLHFPDRIVLLRSVPPTPEEVQLIRLIAKPIQKLNRLAQISILQALTSSPDALATQLENMGRNGTFPSDVAASVRALVKSMQMSAKLKGVATLVEQLLKENPKNWRMVVFTQRRETQTTIQAYLESLGISVGIINGDSGDRNQSTIGKFRTTPPGVHVIVSTEAGSEGVNLQAANVLVNYDLPWNPMIVEQRIGRIQRLASEHAKVFVYNVILRGTFEEYIVGRLLEKLQMASHAIGDIESLLEASGMGGGDDDGSEGIEEEIRRLVIDSLAGKDVEAAMRKAEESIAKAKVALAEEEKNINELLGAMDGAAYRGPRSPDLPVADRSMSANEFTLRALTSLGATLKQQSPDKFQCELDGRRDTISLTDLIEPDDKRTIVYQPGTPAFDRLITRITQSGVHDVRDLDVDPSKASQGIAASWVESFNGIFRNARVNEVRRHFTGQALLQVRATVAHDSYERLITVDCSGDDHQVSNGREALEPIPSVIEKPEALGLNLDRAAKTAVSNPNIAEFCRFYTERKREEVQAAGGDARLSKKLEDEFTPRLQSIITGLKGSVHRVLTSRVTYSVDGQVDYVASLTICPSEEKLVDAPPVGTCAKTGKAAPRDALGTCSVTGAEVLQHLLVRSETSGKTALPEYSVFCSLTGKLVLASEVELSYVTHLPVIRTLLKTSSLSGRKAEPQHVAQCEFTKTEALLTELTVSQVSGRRYRSDQSLRSTVSGKAGHESEFVTCPLTNRLLCPDEADRCDVTGKLVYPGLLEECSVSHRYALPSELEQSSVSGQKALKQYFVFSSVSGAKFLKQESVRSSSGNLCTRTEAARCAWSQRESHPDDLRICGLTGLSIHFSYATREQPICLSTLFEMLRGLRRTSDNTVIWDSLNHLASSVTGGRCRVESSQLSPDGHHLAVSAEQRTLLGLRVRHIGFVYAIDDRAIVGRLAIGKRTDNNWHKTT